MGLQAVPAYIASPGFQHPAVLDRNMLEGVFNSRQGALRAGEFIVSPTAGTRAIIISPGRYHVLGTENLQQGGYFAWSDTADTFLLAAGVGNPRIDTLVLRIHDDQYGSIPGTPGAYWEIVQGVAAGSPTALLDADFNVGGTYYVPGAWARIADIRVNVGDVAIPGGQITNQQRYTRHNGWTICSAATKPSDMVINDHVYEFDTDFRRRWNGSAWQQADAWVSTTALVANAADIHMTGIPTSMRTLEVEWFMRCAGAVQADVILCRVNNVNGNHAYTQTIVQNVTSSNTANSQGANNFSVGLATGASATGGAFGSGVMKVANWSYANNAFARFNWISGAYGSTAANAYNEQGQGTYFTAGPYTSLRFFMLGGSNLVTGSWVRVTGWE